MISSEKIKTWIKEGESEQLEFKTTFTQDVIETLVAFANARGGRVLLGVNDNGELKDIVLGKESINQWINEIKSKTIPLLIPDMDVVEVDGKNVVCVSIMEYPVKPVSCRGRYFRRKANTNHQLLPSEVANLHLQSINSSWDCYVNEEKTMDDISFDKIQTAIERMQKNHISVAEDPLSFLYKYNLIKDDKLTNAAFLLFKKDDSFDTTIELGRFQTEIIIKDSARSKSDIITQIETVMSFVIKHINKRVIITGSPYNTQKWQYPLEAIREIVTNMVVHRDYRSSSDSIVKIFNDRIEFYNPGRLPEDITIDDLLKNTYRSTPRNKLIADCCKDMGIVEKYGSGIRRIINYFKEENLPLPTFGNIADGFMVTVFAPTGNIAEFEATVEETGNCGENFKSTVEETRDFGRNSMVTVEETVEKTKNCGENSESTVEETRDCGRNSVVTVEETKNCGENLEDTVEKILEILINNPQITQTELAEMTNLTRRGVEWNLSKLKAKGLIERVGPNKGGYWKIVKVRQ